ncbi:MAG: CPBP family intramembrane glutamic endopeptidase [Pyrinomonadaceae bacterium]
MAERHEQRFRWRLFWLLLVMALLGALAILPLSLVLQGELLAQTAKTPLPLPMPLLVLIGVAQNGAMLALFVGLGLLLSRKVGLPGVPLLQGWLEGKSLRGRLRESALTGILVGLCVGLALVLLLIFIFLPLVPRQPVTLVAGAAIWKRFLACFYGGVVEEILTRLFFLSLFVWLLNKLLRRRTQGQVSAGVFWVANILVAIIFGLGHLPIASLMMKITTAAVVEALLLNAIASLTFGYLYWKRGLETAMFAHFSADFMLFVIGPMFFRT